MSSRILTPGEVWQERYEKEFSFETLLDPYREGGTQDEPVRRTMGTIVDYFLNKKKYPVDILGAAILLVFSDLYNGRTFDGDGSYGSKGRELITAIRVKCDSLLHDSQQKQMYQFLAENVFTQIAHWTAEEIAKRSVPWYKRLFKREKTPIPREAVL